MVRAKLLLGKFMIYRNNSQYGRNNDSAEIVMVGSPANQSFHDVPVILLFTVIWRQTYGKGPLR